jgi:putative hemolysin
VVTRADGSFLVDGRLSSEELRELLSLNTLPGEEEHDFHTAAGLVIARFGRIPHAGEHFDWQGWRLEVVDLDGARIDKLLIARLPDPLADDGV